MAIIVPILTQFDDKGIKAAVREFERAKTALDKFGAIGTGFQAVGKNLTKSVTLPLLGIGTALAAIVRGAVDAEAAQARLRKLLLTTGGASNAQVDILIKQAEALEKVGVASKESIIITQSQLATFDLQGKTIAKLTPAILDYVLAEKGASATTDDFKSMTNGLAQALNGQFSSLSRIGFVLDEETKKKIKSGTESERAAALVEVLNSTYKGFNETLLQTPEGQLIKLQNEFKQVKDEIGVALLPVMNDFLSILRTDLLPIVQSAGAYLKVLVERFAGLSDGTKKQLIYFSLMIAALGPLLIGIGYVTKSIVTLIGVVNALQKSILRIPLLIVAVIGVFISFSDTQAQVALDTGNTWAYIKRVIYLSIKAIVQTVELFINGLQTTGAVFKYLSAVVVNFFDTIKGRGRDLRSFSDVLDSIKYIDLTTHFENIYNSVGDFTSGIKEAANGAKQMAIDAAALQKEIEGMTVDVGNNTEALDKNADKAKKAKDALDKLKKAAVEAAQVVVNNLEESLRKAEAALDDVKGKFNNFKDAISSTISGILNFGKAAEDENFLLGLSKQAVEATKFADKVKQLVVLGLNERAIREVLNAGFEAGSLIADEIIAGGATVVRQVNELVDAVDSVAEQVGYLGAQTFYQAGVTQGEALVAGIKASLEAARADLKRITDGIATGVSTTTTSTASQIAYLQALKPTPGSGASFRIAEELDKLQSASRFAKGGIVLGPTNAIIGEAGPEAVIPLSGANSAGMGSTFNITVNAGIGTDGAVVGRQIVDAIRKYERSSGQVFARV